MIIIIRTIKVRRHSAEKIAFILAAVGLAQFDARDFGDSVPLVGRFQRTGEEGSFLNRLRRQSRIDTRTAQEKEFFHACPISAMNQMVLNLQVFIKEFGWVRIIGLNAADPGGCDEDVFGPGGSIKILDRETI